MGLDVLRRERVIPVDPVLDAAVLAAVLLVTAALLELEDLLEVLEGLCSSAAEGTASPPLSLGARPCTREESADAQSDPARNRTPLRADLPERALLEGGDVLESSLLGTNANNN